MKSRGKQISLLVMRPAILNRSSPRLFNRQPFTAGFHMNGNAVSQDLGKLLAGNATGIVVSAGLYFNYAERKRFNYFI
jgi:hypothetical protein